MLTFRVRPQTEVVQPVADLTRKSLSQIRLSSDNLNFLHKKSSGYMNPEPNMIHWWIWKFILSKTGSGSDLTESDMFRTSIDIMLHATYESKVSRLRCTRNYSIIRTQLQRFITNPLHDSFSPGFQTFHPSGYVAIHPLLIWMFFFWQVGSRRHNIYMSCRE